MHGQPDVDSSDLVGQSTLFQHDQSVMWNSDVWPNVSCADSVTV